MSATLPRSVQRIIQTPDGDALGISNRWHKGQYCAIMTKAGFVGCGIYDIDRCDEFDFAFAIACGTPAHPLVEPEDLFPAKIVRVSKKGEAYGIKVGMTGEEAMGILIRKSRELA